MSEPATQARHDEAANRSVAAKFLERVAKTPDGEAFRYVDGGTWRSLTWSDVGKRVRAWASGLRALGLRDEDRVAVLSGTRVEWVLADLAILCAGGATTTIYPSTLADDCAFILSDSASVLAFAEDDKQVKKLLEVRAQVPQLKKVVVLDGKGSDDGWVVPVAELERLGGEHDAQDPAQHEEIVKRIRADSLATLIYTSGTTGRPKGVELTHDCWLYEGEAIDELKLLTKDDVQYLWLPLAHAFGKVLEAAQIQIGFPTAIDGRVDKIVENLAVVRPTFVAAVPRIFEKVHSRIVTTASQGSPLKRRIFAWAFAVGGEVSKLVRDGKPVPFVLGLKHKLADKLVFSTIRARFGGRLRFFISGSAALSRDVAEFFHAAGVLVLEGYGLTESSAASFVNWPHRFKFGTVGLPLPGTEVKIADSDGEILIRGRGIMRRYHGLESETKETLDGEGWLHTGDIGALDEDGFLKITDRKKELIKTSGGKYVAPQALEGKLKALCPFVSQIAIQGEGRKFVAALVTLDADAVKPWAKERGLADASMADLAANPETKKLLQGYFDQLNKGLASYETVKKFAILPADFTIEANELTPSLKLKRKVIAARYKEIVDAMFVGGKESDAA